MNDQEHLFLRARKLLNATAPAVAGCGGDRATYRAARALVKGFELSPEAALPLLQEWNARCEPPWRDGDLRAKLAGAARSQGPSGWLLQGDRVSPVERRDTAAERRARWPVMRRVHYDEPWALAALRGLSLHAVTALNSAWHLWRCRWRGVECYAVRHGRFAQVRRMDGQPFAQPDGTPVKALCLPGSEGAFLHPWHFGGADVPVILTEGAVSLLEAVEMIVRAEDLAGECLTIGVLAAVSAGSRFPAELLARLSGRRVRIFPDADEAGQQAAARWACDLRRAGCTVDCINPPAGCKDPGEALRTIPATDPCWLELLTF